MDIDTETGLEMKAGMPAEAVVTHAEMMRAFEEFKEANDQQDRRKAIGDVVLEEKLARIDNAITAQGQRLEAVELKQARPASATRKPRQGKRTRPRSSTKRRSKLTSVPARAAICARLN